MRHTKPPRISLRCFCRLLGAVTLMVWMASVAAWGGDFEFTQPQCITRNLHSVVPSASDPYYLMDNYRMSRNAGSQMDFDSSGTLHLTYWSGFSETMPDSPSAVYYQSWRDGTGWSSNTLVDQSVSDDPGYLGKRMGGRHPSLAVGPDDRVWITWHDHRHCGVDAPYNGINNIEIYCDSKPSTGSFAQGDIRLTQTAASHYGDNGYAPRIDVAPNGSVSVMWYDFHFDGSVSDIFMMTSDASGTFDTAASMASRRLTNSDDRHRLPDRAMKAAFDMPDFAIGAANQCYTVWTHGFGGSLGGETGSPIYFAEVSEPATSVSYATIASQTDSYWYPPKIKAAPNGDLWVIYTALLDPNRRVEIVRRPSGQADFQTPVVVADGPQDLNGDLAIDSQGRLHVVWIGDAGFGSGYVRYAMLSSDGQTILREETLTPDSGAWSGPCIVVDDRDHPFITFCEGDNEYVGDQGDIWFVYGFVRETAPGTPGAWMIY